MIPNTILMWREVIEYLAGQPVGTVVRIETYRIEHPSDGGLGPMMGMPVGQRGNWGGLLPDGTLVAASDFGDYYDVTLHLPLPPPRPVLSAAPLQVTLPTATSEAASSQEMVVGLTALGALLGLALGRSKDGLVTGALLGGATALAGIAVKSAQASPETSRAALDALEAVTRAMTAKSSPPRTTSAQTRALPPKSDSEKDGPARHRKLSTVGRKRRGS